MIAIGSIICKISDNKPYTCIRVIVKSSIDEDRYVKVGGIYQENSPHLHHGTYIICLDDGWFESEEEAWENYFSPLEKEKEQNPVKIIKSIDNVIVVKDMKDGDIGEIVQWISGGNYIGRIVQRYDNHLIALGQDSGKSFQYLFSGDSFRDDCCVRILPKGTQLEI
jgi:hypothetical protein